MKKLILLLLTVTISPFAIYAQMEIGHHYKIKSHYRYSGSLDIRYKVDTGSISKKIQYRRLKAALSADSAGRVKIDFWGFKNCNCTKINDSLVSCLDSAAKFYFQINKRELLSETVTYKTIPYALMEIGAVTIPFKYWKGKNSIDNSTSTDFNAGVYIGRKWGRQRFYYDKDKNHKSVALTLAAFSGFSKLDLTKDNIDDTLIFKKNSSQLNFSIGTGAMLSYRSFNIGLFTGYDLPLSTEGRNWLYAYKRWIGFGVGYSINLLGK